MKFGPRPCTIVQGLLSDFGATLKNHKKSNLDRNQLKISTQHKYMYMFQKKFKKWRILSKPTFDEIWPETMYYSTGTFVQFWSNFKKS